MDVLRSEPLSRGPRACRRCRTARLSVPGFHPFAVSLLPGSRTPTLSTETRFRREPARWAENCPVSRDPSWKADPCPEADEYAPGGAEDEKLGAPNPQRILYFHGPPIPPATAVCRESPPSAWVPGLDAGDCPACCPRALGPCLVPVAGGRPGEELWLQEAEFSSVVSSWASDSAHDLGQISSSLGQLSICEEPGPQTVQSYCL